MASITKRVVLDAPAEQVWDAVRDFGAIHERLVPGFVLETKMDGNDARIVMFANGTVARELLVDCNDDAKRLVYAVISERIRQHSASVQVFSADENQSELVWIVDVLPNEIAPTIANQMDAAAVAMTNVFALSTARR